MSVKLVEDVMSEPLLVPAWESVEHVRARARKRGEHYVLLVDRDLHLAGIACFCDLDATAGNVEVGTIAHTSVVAVPSHAPVEAVVARMRHHGIGAVPVLAKTRVVGIVTREDLESAGIAAPAPCTCPSCGGERHVHSDPRLGGVRICAGCAAHLDVSVH